MIYCVLIGASTGFIFLMVMLFVSGGAAGLDNVILSPAGPLLEIFYTATSSKAGKLTQQHY
jgi:choline transport protein